MTLAYILQNSPLNQLQTEISVYTSTSSDPFKTIAPDSIFSGLGVSEKQAAWMRWIILLGLM